jgi:hypothetical protein
VPQLLRNALHLPRAQPAGVEKHRQTVAAVWSRTEDVDVRVFETGHRGLSETGLHVLGQALDGSFIAAIERPAFLARRDQQPGLREQREMTRSSGRCDLQLLADVIGTDTVGGEVASSWGGK